MKKFYLKYKKDIIILVLGSVSGAMFSWPISKLLDSINSKINYNKFLSFIIDLLKYRISFSIRFILLLIIISLIIYKIWQKIKNYILSKKGLLILSAKYGAAGKYIDIKNELNNRIEDEKLEVVLDNFIAGDPIIHTKKECKITYRYKGEKREANYKESEIIKLPHEDTEVLKEIQK